MAVSTRFAGLLAAALLVLCAIASTARADEDVRLALAHPIVLTDPDGKRVSTSDFPGELLLVYFGYTHCSDQCPTSVSTMVEALTEMGPAARHVQPVFITVDPERDTGPVLKDYTAAFDPRLLGLTGSPTEIRAAADAVGVQYEKVELNGTGDYSIDHSWTMSVIDTTGRNARTFSFDAPHMLAKTLFDMLAKAGVDLEDVPNIGAFR